MTTYTTTLELIVNGHACVHDAEVSYDYEPAGGDDRNEPAYSERATVYTVKVGDIDIKPMLTKNVIKGLEADCCEHEAEEREETRA